MKIFVCFCLVLGATFVRVQGETTTVSVETSSSENLVLNETNAEASEMEANASETTSTTLKNEMSSPGSNQEKITSSEDLLTAVSHGSNPETTSSAQESVTTLSRTDPFIGTSQPVSNFTDLGENDREDQSTTQEQVSLENTVVTATYSTIQEVTNATVESTRVDTQTPAETMVQTTTQEVVNETTTVAESLTTASEMIMDVTRVAVEIASQHGIVQTDAAELTSTTTTPHTTASTNSNIMGQPQSTCNGFFECFDLPTIVLILAFAAGAAFVVIISFVICRRCVKSSPDGKYSLMSSSESP